MLTLASPTIVETYFSMDTSRPTSQKFPVKENPGEENPKSEYRTRKTRNPKQIRITNRSKTMNGGQSMQHYFPIRFGFRRFVSDFGFRISSFPPPDFEFSFGINRRL